MTLSVPVLPAETVVDGSRKRQISLTRKLALLSMLCFAQFLDIFNNSALFPAVPVLDNTLGITQSQSAWVFSAYQLTFASFLLISGRMSDVYNPKKAFIAGIAVLGIISIVAGFVDDKIAIIILRALMGIAAAMTIPSALTLLVRIFPEPIEQVRAISVFGASGAVGNVLGLFIGAVFVQYASYHWIFWFVGVVAIPIALFCSFLVPPEVAASINDPTTRGAKWKSLDLIGVSILTIALTIFIYAVTSGAANGWATAEVLTPLIISVLLVVGFFYWETIVPPENAAIPPRTWFYTNFSVLFASALFPLCWWSVIFLVYTTLWQDVFQWTVISTAIHMFPLGVAAFAMTFTGPLSRIYGSKWIILFGFALAAMATVLLAIGGSNEEDYWPYVFPAFVLGACGAILVYTHTNIAIFQTAPASMAGTVGAIFNGALQLGSAVGLAAFNSIQASVQATEGADRGQAAAFWFLLGITLVELLFMSHFYHRVGRGSEPKLDDKSNNDVAMKALEEKPNEGDRKDGTVMTK